MENEPEQHTPTLSVTVLNYNYAHYLPQCLDSILSQTWTDFELILINDCSTDNSLEVIQPYLADPRIKFVNHEVNKGFVASLIEGSNLSRGKYITVISADDYCMSPKAFASLLELLEADDGAVFAYSAYGTYDKDGICSYHCQPHQHSYVRSGVEEFREYVLNLLTLHSGTIIRAAAYHAVGGYDASARYAVDCKLFLKLCSQGSVAYCADELYASRIHHSNMSHSRNGIRAGLRETIDGIDEAFAVLRDSLEDPDDLYRRAINNTLVAVATNDVFGGQVRDGWYSYWCALQVHPLRTAFQWRTLSLISCTLLGAQRMQALRTILRRDRTSTMSA